MLNKPCRFHGNAHPEPSCPGLTWDEAVALVARITPRTVSFPFERTLERRREDLEAHRACHPGSCVFHK